MRTRTLLLWMLAVAASVALPGWLSMHTGDDLGYMFTDSVHHGGDGHRVASLMDCLTTQLSHYTTTNGRFLVHTVVMAMLNLVPLWVYRVLNALMAALVWLGLVKLSGRQNFFTCALAWLLLILGWPQPATVLTTLVSYSVNYLWVSAAMLWLIIAIHGRGRSMERPYVLVPLAFLCGTLHEGWSLPVCAGMLYLVCRRRVHPAIFAAFVVGAAIEVFAPGNWAHAAQGGGFTPEAIAFKLRALASFAPLSLITYALAAYLVWLIARPQKAWAFAKDNAFWMIVAGSALAMATVTFTAPRQLSCPTVAVMVMILRAWQPGKTSRPSRRALGTVFCALAIAASAAMFALRLEPYKKYQHMLHEAQQGRAVLTSGVPVSSNLEPRTLNLEPRALKRSFAPDPLENIALQAVGDRYTRDGLSRLYGHPVRAILPYTAPSLAATASTASGAAGPFRVLRGTAPRGIRILERFIYQDSTYTLVYAK